jgi:hypothetical protein
VDEAEDARLTPMRRLFERSKVVLGVIVAIALVVPLGAGLLDRLGFLRAEDRVLDELADDDLDVALVEAVLRVGGTRCGGAGTSSGTAFALDLDGEVLLLTNRHVVEDMRTVGLRRLDGSAGPRVAAWQLSDSADVAVLHLEDGQPMPPALGLSSRPAEAGDDVRTVGFRPACPTRRRAWSRPWRVPGCSWTSRCRVGHPGRPCWTDPDRSWARSLPERSRVAVLPPWQVQWWQRWTTSGSPVPTADRRTAAHPD